LQTVALPEIEPGCAGIFDTVTARLRAVPVPQSLLAVTETLPLPAPTVTVIELVVDVPVHPVGSDHV
jgi:hypothetical protein